MSLISANSRCCLLQVCPKVEMFDLYMYTHVYTCIMYARMQKICTYIYIHAYISLLEVLMYHSVACVEEFRLECVEWQFAYTLIMSMNPSARLTVIYTCICICRTNIHIHAYKDMPVYICRTSIHIHARI